MEYENTHSSAGNLDLFYYEIVCGLAMDLVLSGLKWMIIFSKTLYLLQF
jgi:hypothetical protein